MRTRPRDVLAGLMVWVVWAGLVVGVVAVMWHLLGSAWDAFDAAAGIGGTQGKYTATSCESIEEDGGEDGSTAWRCVGTFRSDDGRVVRTGVVLPDSDAQVGKPTRMIDSNGEFLLPGHSTVFWQFLEVAFWWVLGFAVLAALGGAGMEGGEDSSNVLVRLWAGLCLGMCMVAGALAGVGVLLVLPVGFVLAIVL